MYQTLSTTEAANLLLGDEYAGWSRAGAYALAEYLDGLEDDTGEPIEFCKVSIRCDFSEYDDAEDVADDYGWTPEDGGAVEWLQDRTTVIEFDGGVIIQDF